MDYVKIIIGSIFVNNFVLTQFLGICPTLGTSKKFETASRYGYGGNFRNSHCLNSYKVNK